MYRLFQITAPILACSILMRIVPPFTTISKFARVRNNVADLDQVGSVTFSVVDPDPVGFENFGPGRIRILNNASPIRLFWLRICNFICKFTLKSGPANPRINTCFHRKVKNALKNKSLTVILI
jgi:hypothetical protein